MHTAKEEISRRKITLSSSFLPASDTGLDTWAVNFAEKATQYESQIPLSSTEVKALQTAQQEFNAAIEAHVQAVHAARARRVAKLLARRKLTNLASAYNARIQADTKVSSAAKTDMGLTVRRKPLLVTPLRPIQVTVTGTDIGINTVRWKPGSNKRGTVYHIEAMRGDAGQWVLVGSVTATRFDHSEQTPGVRVLYRIVARRRNAFSIPSVEVAVYPMAASSAPVLQFAKAA